MSDLKPIAYAIYGIGGGKHYLKDVKPIPADDVTEEWRGDDDFLGDYWAGNEPLFLESTQPEATAPASDGPRVIRNTERELVAIARRSCAPAQDLSAAILAMDCPDTSHYSVSKAVGYEQAWDECRRAAAALASPADALVAGDRVDAALMTAAKAVVREALDNVCVHPCDQRNDAVKAKGLVEPVASLYAAILQSQKGDSDG